MDTNSTPAAKLSIKSARASERAKRAPARVDGNNTKKIRRRRVLFLPWENNDEDFTIDEDDYLVVRELLLNSRFRGDEINEEARKVVCIEENDEERRVWKIKIMKYEDVGLPASIGQLENLTHLEMMDSHIEESLLLSIGELKNLEYLNLRESSIASLPPSICELQNLQDLHLGWTTKLVSLPEEIGNLTSLSELTLYYSGITLLPPSIGELKNLQVLDLADTENLAELPEEIGGLLNLKSLNLQKSKIASFPRSLKQLQNLQDLDLSLTENLSNLPEEIGSLASLSTLNLYYSSIISLPPSIGKLKNLQRLDLSFTKKLVQLPEEIGDLLNLKKLDLYNSMIVSLPPSLGRLQNLQDLDLSLTENLSNLPEEIGSLVSLNKLNLCYSRITSLPPSIGELKNLRILDLCNTENLVKLPEEIGDLLNLKSLNLQKSKIALFPRSLKQLQNLTELCLSGAAYDSQRPMIDFTNFSNSLKVLYLHCLSWAEMKSLPDSIGRLTGLMHLNFGPDMITLPNNLKAKRNELLLMLPQRCPLLGYLDILDWDTETYYFTEEEYSKLQFALACNRSSFRMRFGTSDKDSIQKTPKLWPRVLNNAPLAFDWYPEFRTLTLRRRSFQISKPDAIYHLLINGRESILQILHHRSQHGGHSNSEHGKGAARAI